MASKPAEPDPAGQLQKPCTPLDVCNSTSNKVHTSSSTSVLNLPQTESSPTAVKPKIFLSGHEALVWDVQDVKELRQKHRIIGSLSGSLPRNAMQNIFQGLPLRLLPEEVYALWSNGLVDLVDESRSYNKPVNTSDTEPQQIIETGVEASAADTKSNSSGHVSLHTQSSHLKYFSPFFVKPFHRSGNLGLFSQDTINDTQQPIPLNLNSSPLLKYPISTKQQLQCSIFINLWASQKFFVAPGMKFGGDYLLYKNDPLICHASLIATVKEAETPLSLADIASSARLASAVQKQHLFCTVIEPKKPYPSSSATSESSPGTASHEIPQVTSSNTVMFVVEWAGF
ncbi:tRNA-splicing endonuclease subunit [Entomortierella lignicola]|nr:tRNA-splicing endonuclease subunit [Entomortierella lignicola]